MSLWVGFYLLSWFPAVLASQWLPKRNRWYARDSKKARSLIKASNCVLLIQKILGMDHFVKEPDGLWFWFRTVTDFS